MEKRIGERGNVSSENIVWWEICHVLVGSLGGKSVVFWWKVEKPGKNAIFLKNCKKVICRCSIR